MSEGERKEGHQGVREKEARREGGKKREEKIMSRRQKENE